MKRHGLRHGLRVVLFAGGGGSCTGIRAALGEEADIAVNHDAVALKVHATNHPKTRHLVSDVWEVDPRTATRGRPVDLLWASPDCTHHSRAKGGKPKENKRRSLAWVVLDWARDVRPRIVFLENVEEFQDWGPLYPAGHPDEGHPIPERAGETFAQFRGALEMLGYAVDLRVLNAADYGAPTKRRRLFMVARCDGQPIRWPEPTHGPGRAHPYRTAAECIDWSLSCPSIFLTKEEGKVLGVRRPLAEKTMWRIAEGLRRFVLDNPSPFIVKVNHGKLEDRSEALDEPLSTVTAARRGHALVAAYTVRTDMHRSNATCAYRVEDPLRTITTGGGHAIVAPTLIQTGYGERPGQAPRALDLHQPLGTVVAGGLKHALVAAFLAKHYGGHTTPGAPLGGPVDTVTTRDHHALVLADLGGVAGRAPQVRAFLTAYYGCDGDKGQDLREPCRTVTTKDRLGLVMVEGVEHQIVDIGMRMLRPHELLRAQFGRFADSYNMSAAETQEAQVRLIGNSVCPDVAEALVRANCSPAAERRAA